MITLDLTEQRNDFHSIANTILQQTSALISALSKYLSHFNDFLDNKISLRRGERKKVFLLQANIFIIISVLLILKPVFTSMMLSFHGVSIMPVAYIGIALSAVLVHSITSFFTNKKQLIKLIYFNHALQIAVLLFIALSIYLGFLNEWMSLGLYIYISIFALVTVTYFYQYCQSLLTIRDAKRIYAFIGSGAIAGGVFGGYFTSIFVPIIGNVGLVVSSAVLMIISGIIIRVLHSNYKEDEANTLYTKESPVRANQQFSIFKNLHVRNLAMIIGLGVLVSKFVDYQFNFLALDHISGEDALTSFFGFWFSTINVIGLLIQMFLVTKIIDRFGVSKSLFIMPIFLFLGGMLVLFFPIILFGVLIKLFEGSLKQSLYKTSTEITIMPLANSLRNRAKTFVDVVVDSLATGMAGVIIYFLINKGNLPFYFIGLMSLATIAVWIFFVYKSSMTYKVELAKMVKGDHLSLDESERVGSVVKKIAIDEYLKKNKSKGKSPRSILLKLTKHKDVNLRKSAILKYISNYGIASIKDIEHATNDPSILVRKAVFFAYIMMAKNERQIDDIYNALKTDNYIIVTAALAEGIGNNTKQKRIYRLNERIDEAYNRLTFDTPKDKVSQYFGQIFRAITISKYIKRYNLISDAIKNNANDSLQKEALKAIGYGRAKRFFDVLDVEDIAEENMQIYFKTLSVFPVKLLQRLQRYKLAKSKRLFKDINALEYVDNQKHIDFLFSLLDYHSLKVRRLALKIINLCRKKYPHLSYARKSNIRRLNREIKHLKRISAAITYMNQEQANVDGSPHHVTASEKIKLILQRHANKSILAIFIYMALITQKEELEMIYQAIKSTRRDAALDLLDGILDYKIRRRLIPVLELVVHKRFTSHDLKRINQRSLSKSRMNILVRQLKDERLLKLYLTFNRRMISGV